MISLSLPPCNVLCGKCLLISATVTGTQAITAFSLASCLGEVAARLIKTTNKTLTYLQNQAEVSWGLVFALKVFAIVDI